MKLLKSSEQSTMISLQNVNVVFDLHRTNTSTLKEVFINFFHHPLEMVFHSDDIFHCLKKINLSIKKGDRIALLGRNGAGKTTLCQILSGILKADYGQVTKACRIRTVYHSTYHLFPELSGRENAKLLTRLLYPELSRSELFAITEEAIEFSELGLFADAPIKTYSKGMSSRLLLSLVTARRADLLIMDELFDGADQFFMQKLGPRLDKVVTESDACLFVKHDVDLLKKYCNRVIVLHQGKIVFDGAPIKGFFYYENQSWTSDSK